MALAKKITLKDTPEVLRLLNEGEDPNEFMHLPPEHILIRWINFHLKNAGAEKLVTNLGTDLSDSTALIYLLNQLDSTNCSLDALTE